MGKNKKNNTIKNNNKKTYDLIFQTTYVVVFCLIGFLLTLYVHDAYYDIMEAKASCFFFIMAFSSPFLVSTFLYRFIINKESFVSVYLDIGLIILLAVSSISTVLSIDPIKAVSGEEGWKIGSGTIFCLTVLYFTLRRNKIKTKTFFYPLFVICGFEFFLTVFDAAGMDLFHFRDVIDNSLYYSYFATIGNSNWNVGYLSLFVPLFVCLYIKEENTTKKCFYYLLSLSGFLASILNGADGIYLAYGFCSFFILPLFFESLESLKRTSVLVIGVAASIILVNIIPAFDRRLQVLSGYGRILFDFRCSISLLVLGIAILLFSMKANEDKYMLYKMRIIHYLEIFLAMCAIGTVILAFLGSNGDFGNGRFEIWKESFDVFKNDYSLLRKLFGVGPELLQHVYGGLSEKYGVIYNSSHSEPIHMLMSMGIMGLLAWCYIWFIIFRMYLNDKKENNGRGSAIFMGLFAYFGQSFVNSATILNLSTLALFVIVLSENTLFCPLKKHNINHTF